MEMKKVSDYYDSISEEYCNKTRDLDMSKYLNKFLQYLPDKESNIIDFGCGSGRDIKYIINKGYNKVIGIDSSIKMVEESKKYTNVNNIFLNDSLSGINNRSINGIWANSSLIHLYIPELLLFIEQANLVLKNEGVLYCSFKKYNSLNNENEKKICLVKESKECIIQLFNNLSFKCIFDEDSLSILNNSTIWFNLIFKKGCELW